MLLAEAPFGPLVVSVAAAVNNQGLREVLGMAIDASEVETFWTGFLRNCTRHGLSGVTHARVAFPLEGERCKCGLQPEASNLHLSLTLSV